MFHAALQPGIRGRETTRTVEAMSWQNRRPSASARVTRGAAWKRARKRVLDRDDHLCQLRIPGRCIGHATEVDKRLPASVAPELALDEDNLRAVCRPCHAVKTAREAAAASKRSPRRRTAKRPPRTHPSDVL
jgi:5-methylcytosine-specific restriction protein A